MKPIYSKSLKFILLAFLIYLLNSIIILYDNHESFGFIFYKFEDNLIKLNPCLQATTAPAHYIDENQLEDFNILKKHYPDLKTYDIHIVGKTPYEFVNDPIEVSGTVFYGTFEGYTDEYKDWGYEKVPVFNAKYYDDISQFSLYEVIIIVLPLPIFLVLFVVLGISYCLRKITRKGRAEVWGSTIRGAFWIKRQDTS